MRSPSDPLVLALEKDNKATKGKPKWCCSTCSINQRCTHPDKVYQAEALEQETEDILKPAPRRQERRRVVGDANSEPSLTPTPLTPSLASSSFGRTAIEVGVSPPTPKPRDPPLPSCDSEWDEPEPLPPGPKIPSRGTIASRTRKQTRVVIRAPLRQAITSDGETKLIKVPFSSIDLEIWERIAKGYRSDPIGVAKKMKIMIKQHSPDWADLQLLLDALTETEKQLVLKVVGDLAEDDCRTTQEDVKDVFPLQDPGWDPNDDEGLGRLKRYQELIVKGLERAIPKTINWSALYAIKQGPSQTPSEFLDHLRDAMHRHTTLDPGSDEGKQQLINLFLGQSTGGIRRKLQKIRGPNSRNLETLLDEAWRVFSNREEGYKQGMKKLAAVVKEGEKGKHGQGPPKQGPPRLGKDQCAFCKKFGHWKKPVPRIKKGDLLEQLEARIIFKNGEISLEVKDQQYVELLSLMLITKEIEVASEKENFRKIMDQVSPGVWASNIPGRAKNALPVQIRLKEGGQPVRVKQYPLKKEDIEGVSPIIENFLQLGLLRECQSDFNTPILPVKKPDGSYRLVQDLRAVNKVTEDLYPVVANPYTLLTRLTPELTWFTVLDLKDAFFCLPLHEASQKIFAFEWESPKTGRKTQLAWCVLPQGYKNSPTIFGEQLAKDLESWEPPPGEGQLLQYVDDLLMQLPQAER
ncbi:hypothetical protein DUI87_19079 [Hirundo rustica rustica]|uniref:ribonuclease H n=1 Tax=Hirundo rustica rustica TaxID=333673 RepID=A0A3M0JZE1_HIRRU|nr:hypothetical protein DUI87_19079 [Hirundo rustica rustica]